MSQPQLLVVSAAERPLLDPTNPREIAREFVQHRYSHPEGRLLHHQQGEFFHWRTTHYVSLSEEELRSALWAFLDHAERLERQGKNGPLERVPFKPSAQRVSDVMQALRAFVQAPAAAPCWLFLEELERPASETRACGNGLLHLPTRQLQKHSPRFFTTAALPYTFEPAAGAPATWLGFLQQLWPNDPDMIACLQEFMGYSLTPDTKFQKILLIVGPRRSGKGTIGRVLTALLGEENVAGPSLGSLATNFGMAPLIGKNLALVSDARLSGRADQSIVLERLLVTSGEDIQSIDRKYGGAWTGRIAAKLVLLSNELPNITDASAALASRFIVLETEASFLGREDHDLTPKILRELPAILNWAIDGLDRLTKRGRFQMPARSAEAMQVLEDLASPVKAFLNACCAISPDGSVGKTTLYNAYKAWCIRQGISAPSTAQVFGRNLRAALPRIKERRASGGDRTEAYVGIALKGPILG